MGSFDSGRASDFGGVNIESRRADSVNGIRFDSNRDDPSSANDVILYRGAGSTLRFWDGSSVTQLGSSGGLISYSLDDGYNDGAAIVIDGAAVNLIGSHATNNTMQVSGSGSGNLIDITNTGSGADIDGTSSTWSVSAAGAAVFTAITGCDTIVAAANLTIDATGTGTIKIGDTSTGAVTIKPALTATASIVITGAAAANKFTVTAGDMVMSDGSISVTDADDAATLTLINNSCAAANLVDINADGITSGYAIHIDSNNGGNFTTGGYFEVNNGSASVFTIKRYGATIVAGNATGTSALTLTAGDFTMTDGAGFITQSANAAALTIVADAVVGNNVIDVNADGVTTGTLLHLDSTAAGFAGKFIQCYNGASDVLSVGLDGATIITTSSTGTIGLTIASASTTGDALDITCTALTTGDALQITSTAETLAAGELLKIVNTEDGDFSATPKTGNLCSITSSATMTTNSASLDYDTLLISRSNIANQGTKTLTAAGSVLKLINTSTNTAGTCTDSTKGLEIVMVDSATAAPTGTALDIISVGVGAKAMNIASASTTVSDVLIAGTGVKASAKAVVEVTSTGSTAAGGSILRVAHGGTGDPAAATSYVAYFSQAAATCANNPVAVYVDGGATTASTLQITSSGTKASGAGSIEIINTNAGAAGAVLIMRHTSASPANSDVVSSFEAWGNDSGAGSQQWSKIITTVTDVTAASEDADMAFYVAKAGTVTQLMRLDSDIAGILVGTGAAAGIVSSDGAYDLTLETNGGTNSGTITITDAANGDITITPNGTGQIQLYAPSYGQITTGADGDATLTLAMVGLYILPNSQARTLTLPAMAGSAGAWYTIKKTHAAAAAITIDTPGAETIDGAATFTAIDALYDTATIVSDGTNWHVVSKIIAA